MACRPNLVVAAVLALATLPACTNVVRSGPAAPYPSEIAVTKVLLDPWLNEFAHVTSVRERVLGNGLPMVQVDVTNRLPVQKHFDYKFQWMDGDGMVLRSATGSTWSTDILEAGGTVTLTSLGPTAAARDFRLELVRGGQ